MIRIHPLLLALVVAPVVTRASDPSSAGQSVVVAVGAPGDTGYGEAFSKQAAQWEAAAAAATARHKNIGLAGPPEVADREQLRQALEGESREAAASLWIVLIGHGTFDGREARFNLRGADLTATELADWIKPFKRPLVIVNTSSASAPFIAKLTGPNRIVVTATRSGNEANFARFGEHLAGSLMDPAADLDQDGQTSLLEAFLRASHLTAEFYSTEGRLATEHALLEDNGDGLGTPADWFRGIRAAKKARDGAGIDGLRAHQCHLIETAIERQLEPATRARRDALEIQIGTLREMKTQMSEDDYFDRLEALLLQLAELYRESGPEPSPEAPGTR